MSANPFKNDWSTNVRGDRFGSKHKYVTMQSVLELMKKAGVTPYRCFRKPKVRKPKPFVARTAHLPFNHPARRAS